MVSSYLVWSSCSCAKKVAMQGFPGVYTPKRGGDSKSSISTPLKGAPRLLTSNVHRTAAPPKLRSRSYRVRHYPGILLFASWGTHIKLLLAAADPETWSVHWRGNRVTMLLRGPVLLQAAAPARDPPSPTIGNAPSRPRPSISPSYRATSNKRQVCYDISYSSGNLTE